MDVDVGVNMDVDVDLGVDVAVDADVDVDTDKDSEDDANDNDDVADPPTLALASAKTSNTNCATPAHRARVGYLGGWWLGGDKVRPQGGATGGDGWQQLAMGGKRRQGMARGGNGWQGDNGWNWAAMQIDRR